MTPERDPLGIARGIDGTDSTPEPASAAGHQSEAQGTNGPPSPSRVDVVTATWAALAAYETAAGRSPGASVFRLLEARGAHSGDLEAALELLDLEHDTVVAGLRGRVEDLDAEVEEATAALHRSEVAAFGEAAVTFAHAAHPDAGTAEVARHVMTPTEWLIFERLRDDDSDEDREAHA